MTPDLRTRVWTEAEIEARRQRDEARMAEAVRLRLLELAAQNPKPPKREPKPRVPRAPEKPRTPSGRRNTWTGERRERDLRIKHERKRKAAEAEGRKFRDPPISEVPEFCVSCGQRMFGRKKGEVRAPGAVQHAAKGKCATCYHREKRHP